MNICICDDDKNIHDGINVLLRDYIGTKETFEIFDFFSGEELLENLAEKNFDIIFLDIEMKELSGMQVAEKIREIKKDIIIIFISSHPNYVFEAFRFEALHFIVKPIKTDEFNEVFKRAMSKYTLLNNTVNLKWQNERYSIRVNDIVYVEGYRRHITVHTIKDDFEAIGKIPEIMKTLEPHGFLRVHQGFIVNMDYIKRFDHADIIMYDDSKVMISVRKKINALRQYDEYIRMRKW